MYITMFQLELPTECVEEAVGLWNESVMPILKEQRGWKDAAFIANPETGDLRIFTLWETEEQAQRCESSANSYGELWKLLALGVYKPTRVVYPASDHEIMELYGQENGTYLN